MTQKAGATFQQRRAASVRKILLEQQQNEILIIWQFCSRELYIRKSETFTLRVSRAPEHRLMWRLVRHLNSTPSSSLHMLVEACRNMCKTAVHKYSRNRGAKTSSPMVCQSLHFTLQGLQCGILNKVQP